MLSHAKIVRHVVKNLADPASVLDPAPDESSLHSPTLSA
jgi:hypothetical protein